MASPLRNQLLSVYNFYRTMLFNRKYYAHRLVQCRNWSTALDIVLALATPTTVGTWAIWKTGLGEYAWAIIVAIAAIIAAIKPFLHLPKNIETYGKLWAAYSSLYYDIDRLVSTIAATHTFTPAMTKAFVDARDSARKFIPDDDPKPSMKLRRKFFNEVNREIPPHTLWAPP